MKLVSEIITYDCRKYDFAEVVRRRLSCADLERLHLRSPGVSYARLTDATDQTTEFHKAFYENLDDFLPLYREFVREVIGEWAGSDRLVYQRFPTFRVHLPGNVAVGKFHRDSDYHHVDGEVNFWVPLTTAKGSCSVWIESAPDRGDFQPVTARYGQIVIFDGVHLRHGNKANRTRRTRVSFDFRVVIAERFRGRGDRSVSAGLEMDVGGYFELLSNREPARH